MRPRALKTPGLIAAIAFLGANVGAVNALLAFWGALWLSNAYDMRLSERGALLMTMALSRAVGGLLWGLVPRVFARPLTPVLAGAVVTTLCLALPVFVPLERAWLAPFLVVLGLATGSYPAVLAIAKTSMPKGAIVHAVALVSIGSMIGVFIGQMASGLILDAFAGSPGHHPPEAYSTLFAFFALAMALSGLAYWRTATPSTPSA